MEITQVPQQKNMNNTDTIINEQEKTVKYTTHGSEKTVEMAQTYITSTGAITKIKIPSGNTENALPEIERGHAPFKPRQYKKRDFKTLFANLQVNDCFSLPNYREYAPYYTAARRYGFKLAYRTQAGGILKVQVKDTL